MQYDGAKRVLLLHLWHSHPNTKFMQFLRRLLGSDEAAPDIESSLATPSHVWCVALSGDAVLHVGCADGAIHSWRGTSQPPYPLGTTRGHTGTVYALRTQSSMLISAGADGCIRVWSAAADGTLSEAAPAQSELRSAHQRPVLALALDGKGTIFSGGADRRIRSWKCEGEGWRARHEVEDSHAREVFALALMETLLASAGGDGAVRVWSCIDLSPLLTLAGSESIFALCPSSMPGMGLVLLAGGHAPLCAFELSGVLEEGGASTAPLVGAPLDAGRVRAHEAYVSSIVSLPRYRAASADLRGRVLLWDVPSRTALRSWAAHASGVYALAVLPLTDDLNGGELLLRLVSAASDGAIRLWRLTPDSQRQQKPHAALASDGGAAAAAGEAEADATMPAASELAAGEERVHSWCAFDEAEAVWSVLVLDGGGGGNSGGGGDGDVVQLACGGGGGVIQLWQLGADRGSPPLLRAQLHGHTDAVHVLHELQLNQLHVGMEEEEQRHRRQRLLCSCSADGALRLWDLSSLCCVRALLGHASAVLCGCIAPLQPSASAARFFSGGADGQIFSWDVRPQRQLGGASVDVACVARVTTAHEGEVYALHVCAGAARKEISDEAAEDLLASAGKDGRLHLWALPTMRAAAELGAPRAHRGAVYALALLGGSGGLETRLVSADTHGEVMVWSVWRRSQLHSVRAPGSVYALRVVPANTLEDAWLCAAGGRGDLWLWAVQLGATGADALPQQPAPQVTLAAPPPPAGSVAPRGVLSLGFDTPDADGDIGGAWVFSGGVSGRVGCWRLPAPTLASGALAAGSDKASTDTGVSASAVLSHHSGCVWALGAHRSWLFSGAQGQVCVWHHTAAANVEVECLGELHCVPGGGVASASAAAAAAAAAVADGDAAEVQRRSTVYALLPLGADVLVVAMGDGHVLLWRRLPAAMGETPTPQQAARMWRLVQRCRAHADSVLCLTAAAAAATGSTDVRLAAVVFSAGADRAICRLKLGAAGAGAGAAAAAGAAGARGAGELDSDRTVAAAHEAPIHALALAAHAEHWLLSAAADGTIKLWHADELVPLHLLGAPAAHAAAVYALHIVPAAPAAAGMTPAAATSAAATAACTSPRLFSASADKLIKVWDLNTLECTRQLGAHRSFVCALASSSTRLFSASSDKTCIVWDLRTLHRLRTYVGHTSGLYALAVVDGLVCTGSLDETVRVWRQPEAARDD